MLDGNVKVFYLDRDNRSIASLATLEKDKWLIERGIPPCDPWLRKPEPPGGNEQFLRYILVTDLQVSPHSLPALSVGKNKVRFWHGSAGPVNVTAATSPGDGGEADSLAPVLKWTAATDPDPSDKVVDYQVMVSLRPDCRWPLSPTLWQNVGSEKTEWTVPASFLNPNTTYYWKVRARDSQDNIGEWSRIFQFRTSANAK